MQQIVMQKYSEGANELRDLREALHLIAAMMTNNTAVAATTPAGEPAPSADAVQATAAATPASGAPMQLVAETADNAGAPATIAPAAVPDNDM
eukprot:7433372-Pyramimonas_sp.AAC.1